VRTSLDLSLAAHMDDGAPLGGFGFLLRVHHRPAPERMARCPELRALQMVLALIAFRDDFGDLEGWDDGIRGTLGTLTSLS
jgi:hypothetical protein